MSAPVIVPPLTPRVIARGVAFSVTLEASGEPTSWSATGQPAGLAIDESGVLSGTPTGEGLSTCTIGATNGSGTSDAVQIVFDVRGRPPGAGAWDDVEIDFDLDTGILSLPGHDRSPDAPLLRLKKGDNFPVLLGIRKGGVLQRVDPASEAVHLKLGIKEFEPERLVELSAGTPERTGATADETRYRIPLRLTPQAWQAILDDYEDDGGTEVIALAELQLQVGAIPVWYDNTQTAGSLALAGGLTGGTKIERTLAFPTLAEYADPVQFRLTLTLADSARVGQNVSYQRSFLVDYDGGATAWVVTEATGATSGQQAPLGTRWRATLALVSVTGTGAGVSAALEVTTTNDTTPPYFDLPLDFGASEPEGIDDEFAFTAPAPVLQLWDGTDTDLDAKLGADWEAGSGTWSGGLTEFFAALTAAWQARTEVSDVSGVEWISPAEGHYARVHLVSSSPVQGVKWHHTPAGADFLSRQAGTVAGDASTGTITGRLEQFEIPAELPYSRTSQTDRIAVARDMVPD